MNLAPSSLLPVAPPAPAVEVVPASPAQEQLWALLQKFPDRPLGNLPLAVNLDGPLDPAVLVQALNDVVARHAILHTSLEFNGGRLTQVISAPLHVPVPVIDLRLLPPPAREAQAFRLAREDAARPFDARRLPLLRAQLFLLDQSRHILVFTLHRGIFDHESPGILLRELSACYEARRNGNVPHLPALPRQYPDYARSTGEPPAEADLAWWQARFSSEPPPLRLPPDRSRSGTRGGTGRSEKIELSAALGCSVGILAQREGTNVLTILLAAFQVLLHRYTNLPSFVVGLGGSDRHLPGMEDLLGPCTRIVPFRPDLSGNPRFRILLERVRQEILETYAHAARLGFESLPGRYRNPALACPVQFIHERRSAELVNWPGLRLQELELDTGACGCELSLRLVESTGRWSIRAEYDAEYFSPAGIQQLLAHYQVLLQAAVSQPAARLSELPLLTSLERSRLLHEWNNARVAYPRDLAVSDVVSARAGAEPEATAVTCGEYRLNYRDLDQRSNQLGRHLRAAGVRTGRVVGLYLDRSVELVVAILGILKAGGAVCLFDPSFPPSPSQVERARLDLILTRTAHRELFTADTDRLLLLDIEAADIQRGDESVLAPIAGPDDICWVAWSAGTGGRSRAVEYSHRALVGMLYAQRWLGGIGAGNGVVSTTPLSLVGAATELLPPLAFGGRVELATAEELADPAALAARLASSDATVLHASPSLLHRLLGTGWTGGKALRIHSTGEPLSRELADRLLGQCRELWNTYGTAETAGACVAAPVTRSPAKPLAGRPFGNVQIHLLDAGLQPVPVGLPGEIFVGGDTLASGYRDDPADTVARFPADPFRRLPGSRLFRTGDLACRLPNGEIEYLGRLDLQVPIRPQPRFMPAAQTVNAGRRPVVAALTAAAAAFLPSPSVLLPRAS
ncbi:MAG TPA: condensation domain-containing protein [Lacunisphaera sp.]|nr:condensation domain-containing protein [Lacunisphaera sp.]